MSDVLALELPFAFAERHGVLWPVLVRDERNMVLIDCGYPGFLPKLEQLAAASGAPLTALTHVIITHHDYDHMGALAELKRRYPAIVVVAAEQEAAYIDGSAPSPRLAQLTDDAALAAEVREQRRVMRDRLTSLEHVAVDVRASDRYMLNCCGGIEIIATPGHLPGHASVYLHESRTLVAGDALTVQDDKLAGPNPQYTLDEIEARRSIAKLSRYALEHVICYHGGSCTAQLAEALQELSL